MIIILICVGISMGLASPLPLADNVSVDLLRNDQRRISEENSDGLVKKTSLSSLVGKLESNILASALSFHKELKDKEIDSPEIKVNNDSDANSNASKSVTLADKETNSELTLTITTIAPDLSTTLPANDEVNLPTTTGYIAQANDVQTHIVIDPHTEGLSLAPIFQPKHQKKDGEASKENETADVTMPTVEETSTVTTTTTTEAPMKNIKELKEAEEQLKEKFAEIEAEPVILSARV